MDTKPISFQKLTQTVEREVATQKEKGMRLLTYLVRAQKEVLEFEVGVLEDVLKILTRNSPTLEP